MGKEEIQTELFCHSESQRYVSSYINAQANNDKSKLYSLLGIRQDHVENILEIGCGPGETLTALVNFYGAKNGVGVEPSKVAVEQLKTFYQGSPELSFVQASAHRLPFENDQFDVVSCWSVLHWVGRSEYLQALGELLRVSKKYLIIMDFFASADYKVPYTHKSGLYTYKCDFEKPLLSSGIVEVLSRNFWVMENEELKFVNLEDFSSFKGNPNNYNGRKMVAFKKSYTLLPEFEESYFLRR